MVGTGLLLGIWRQKKIQSLPRRGFPGERGRRQENTLLPLQHNKSYHGTIKAIMDALTQRRNAVMENREEASELKLNNLLKITTAYLAQ